MPRGSSPSGRKRHRRLRANANMAGKKRTQKQKRISRELDLKRNRYKEFHEFMEMHELAQRLEAQYEREKINDSIRT